MRTAVCLTVGVMVLTGMVLTGRAEAVTANGPYYAQPSWDQKLDAATRFVVLSNWNSEAVLDRETGLVWEKSPNTNDDSWLGARAFCINKNVGARKGWRLPSAHELASLVDPSIAVPGPTLPPGHPFLNVESNGFYWSATSNAEGPSFAWSVTFFNGLVSGAGKTNTFHAWCVRGGQSHGDVY